VQQRLDEVSIQKTDVTGLTVWLGTNGTSLARPSLAYCEKTLPSERSRAARRHVDVVNASGKPTGISSESVLYLTPSDASQALPELRCLRDHTHRHHRRPHTDGGPEVLDRRPRGRPGRREAAAPARDRRDRRHGPEGGHHLPHPACLQQRGRLLVGVFVESAGSDLTRGELAATGQLTATISTRLARLDSALTGAS